MTESPNTTSINGTADWVEFYVIRKNRAISKSELFNQLQANDGNVGEEYIDGVINEMIRRKRLYGKSSPFEVEGKTISPRTVWKDKPELAMCLIFSLRGVERKRGEDDGTKLFERLSREAVKAYLDGEAEVIGFPNNKRLKPQIEDLSRLMSEEIGHRSPKPRDKDAGVDIIAWKPHGDMRPNQIVILLQCGAGLNFSQKKPISLKAWNEFIHWSAKPVIGIAIPNIVSDDEWTGIRDDYNLIFDRVRIYRAIYRRHLSDKSLKKQILKWCKSRLN